MWKRDSDLIRSWSDQFWLTSKCDKCRITLIQSPYTHNTQEYRVAWSSSKSHGSGWLCHQCATKSPAPKSNRQKAFSTYEQLDNYLRYMINKEKELWFGKKVEKNGNYHSIGENYDCSR